ncbi:hypothetical protein FZEAL_2796 [Fusarium zealandicum]|uniref:Uncharacterized protein n=1 Tax=Fusarium zealandicum TaxID=1053134 RepID=A0A8H4UQT8_9HYPO|nr:hypothetical protein FZEAL_2796 [Fusarium zealandicum]
MRNPVFDDSRTCFAFPMARHNDILQEAPTHRVKMTYKIIEEGNPCGGGGGGLGSRILQYERHASSFTAPSFLLSNGKSTRATMVIGLLAIAAIPTVTGVGNAVSAQKRQNESLSKEQQKFHLTFIMRHEGKLQEMGEGVVLYLNLPENPVQGHKFLGWYFKYPGEEGHLGLVSMVSVDPPTLNWIYVDKDTHSLTYGARKDTIGHVIGPWGWSEDDRFLTLEEDYDSFVAVREQGPQGPRWAVYWDPEGDIEDAADQDTCQPSPVVLCNSQAQPIMSTMEKERVSAESDDQTMSSEEPPKRERRSKKKGKSSRRKREQQQQQQSQQQQSSGPLDQLPVGGGDVGNTLGGVTNTLGGLTGGGEQQQSGGGGGGGGSDTLRLRLDLNLDIEIQLKARIHGDLELALL